LLLKASVTFDHDQPNVDKTFFKNLLRNRWKDESVMLKHYYQPQAFVLQPKAVESIEETKRKGKRESLGVELWELAEKGTEPQDADCS